MDKVSKNENTEIKRKRDDRKEIEIERKKCLVYVLDRRREKERALSR
jgi:hypothetical protein